MKTDGTVINGEIDDEAGLFIQDIRSRKYSPKSIRIYTDTLQYFRNYLDGRGVGSLLDVDRKLILDYMQTHKDRGLGGHSLEVYFRVIKLLYGYLEDNQKIFVNPTAGMSYMVKKTIRPVPSAEKVISIMNSVDTSTPAGVRNRTMMEFLYGTGVRREELTALNMENLDMVNGTVKVLGKGSKERVVPMGEHLMQWLRRYINEARPRLLLEAETKALWVVNGGGRLGYAGLQQTVRTCNIKLGAERRITIHDFRRAYATHMLQNGASPIDLQAMLGHSSLRHLSCYLRLTISDIKKMHAESRVGQ